MPGNIASKCDYEMYLFKLQNVFVQIRKCICSNCKIYLFKLQNVFVEIVKWCCPPSLQLRWLHWLRRGCQKSLLPLQKSLEALAANLPTCGNKSIQFKMDSEHDSITLICNILHGNVGKCWGTNRQKFCQLCDIWCPSDKACLSKTSKLPYSIKSHGTTGVWTWASIVECGWVLNKI